MLVLDSHNTSTPLSEEVFVLVELSVEVLLQKVKLGYVFLLDISQSDSGSGLLVDKLSEPGLSLDEAEWDSHLSAKCGEEKYQLNGLNVVSNDDELGFLLLNQGGDVVESELKDGGLGSLLLGVLLGVLKLSLLDETLLLLLAGLGSVLSEQLNQFIGYNIK